MKRPLQQFIIGMCMMVGLCLSSSLHAVPAYPGIVKFRQPDGYVLNVRMMGDEYHHWAESEDGYTLLYNTEGFLTLAQPDREGNLQPSRLIVRNVEDRGPILERELSIVGKHARFSEFQIEKARQSRREVGGSHKLKKPETPVVGERKFLVVLMEFPDKKFTHTQQEFHALMNQEGYKVNGNQGSVYDFYYENSFGQLELTSDVAGVYMAEHEMAYYGNNATGVPHELAIEAVQAAAGDYNLKEYDMDGDGYIDGLHIIYAGYGEEAGGGADCIWAHERARGYGAFCEVDGVKMNVYSCSPELRGSWGTGMSYIGVICHEIGHALGTPDFYDVDYDESGGGYCGTGMWDVMGSGGWNCDGACPAHFNPFSKIYDFKWSDIEEGNKAFTAELHDKTKDHFIGIDTHTDGEMFILEYRMQSGFDRWLPGHGLMVWRASGNMSKWGFNKLNASHQQQFYPLAANCTVDLPTSNPLSYGAINSGSAPFPGTNGVTELTDETTPSMKSWAGENTDFPITSIDENEMEGYVRFGVCGGEFGNAYGLAVGEPTMTSLKLTWKSPQADTKVMVIYNTENVFGVPDKAEYTAGDKLDGDGGEVVYVGTATEFLHTDLQPQTYYYYRLCTWHGQTDTWNVGGTRRGKTKPGITNTFPFIEDFNSADAIDGWDVEMIFGSENPWSINDNPMTERGTLKFGTMSFKRQKSRILLPVMNFEGKERAFLSFDYRNWVDDAQVLYRTSLDSPWKPLVQLDNQYRAVDDTKVNYFQLSEKHVDIMLPELSGEYQICFEGDFTPRSNSISSYQCMTIDDIAVNTDVPALVSTQSVSLVGATTASVEFEALAGNEELEEVGVEYSEYVGRWTHTPAASSPCRLTGLNEGTQYDCRAYARTENGYTYGKTMTFTTQRRFFTGRGTEDDPIQIASLDDWHKLQKTVNSGNDCKGFYYVLTTSLTLGDDDFIDKPFNGSLDGGGNTISVLSEGVVDHIIYSLDIDGEIHNVNLSTGALVYTNYGYIHDCRVNFTQEYVQTENMEIFGFLVRRNYGIIHDCHTTVSSAVFYQGPIGGICGYNFEGSITRCTFEGAMSVNNNATLGGIAAINYYNGSAYGTISQCINKGTLSIYLEDRALWCYIGGIAGQTYGLVDQCMNQGCVEAGCSSDVWDAHIFVGGILGGLQDEAALISNCYNAGTVNTSFNRSVTTLAAGGIAGNNYLGHIKNCISFGSVTSSTDYPNNSHSVLGSNELGTLEHCFYTGVPDDSYATKVASADANTQAFVDGLNDYARIPAWKAGSAHPVLVMESEDVTISMDSPQNATTTGVTLSGIVFGEDIEECGFEWREVGKAAWSKRPIDVGTPTTVNIRDLTPAALYDSRIYARTHEGVKYSAIYTFATQFESEGTKEDPVLINSLSDLKVFRQTVYQGNQYDKQYIRLMADIDLQGDKGELWEPITSGTFVDFSGEFDGNGHIIHNMKIVSSAATVGFFGTTGKCYVHDLTILDGDIINGSTEGGVETLQGSYSGGVGGILGANISYGQDVKPLLERCSFTGSIVGGNRTGGLVGSAMNNEIKDCYFRGSINALGKAGGILGTGSYVTDCYVEGTVETAAELEAYGQLTGDYNTIVTNSYYEETDIPQRNTKGTMLTKTEMTDGTLLGLLPEGIWTADNALTPVNDGYPVLESQSAPHVWIESYTLIDDEHIRVDGRFYGAGTERSYATRGVEYTFNFDKTGARQVVGDAANIFSAVIPNLTGDYMAFRAFAKDNEAVAAYGDWVELMSEDFFVPGDINNDYSVDMADAVNLVNYIMGKAPDVFNAKAADVNGDNEINVLDVMSIVNIVLSDNAAVSSSPKPADAMETVNLAMDGDCVLFGVDEASRFTSFQFNVKVPEGVSLIKAGWKNGDNGHSLQFAKTGSNSYTVVALSMDNAPLPVLDGEFLSLQFAGATGGRMIFDNILFVTPEGQSVGGYPVTLDLVTGISGVSTENVGQTVYDLYGRKLNAGQGLPNHGVYIVNKKKVVR